jgi:hypothetical protein
MKEVVKYIALIFFGFLWFLGCSRSAGIKLGKEGFIKDDYRYGDLYRMANLPDFKERREKCSVQYPKKIAGTHLIIAGDSFTEEGRIEDEYLKSEKLTRVRVDGYTSVKLDKRDKNILIIETVERHFRERFAAVWKAVLINKELEQKEKVWYKKVLEWEMPYSEERHEAILFGYDWTMKVREWKALLNYRIFDRVDDKVVLNKTREHLLYYLPVRSGINSAFDPISDEDVAVLVKYVNETYAYYLAQGFDEVILSVIPNKESILGNDLGIYNELIKRIQQHQHLKMPVIDTYTPFEKLGKAAYAKGDTHWSCQGQQVWIDAVNQLLNERITSVNASGELVSTTSF